MTNALQGFRKKVEKIDGVTTNSSPPQYWLNSGCYVVNKVISGSYTKGYACSRLTMITGPSDAGKSFLTISAAVQAQKKGFGVFIVDSEHALDDDYLKNAGLNVDDDLFFYNDVKSLEAAKKVTSEFIKSVRDNKKDLPPILMIVDSLDQLKTKSHVEKSEKGEVHNDQGQHAKQLKQFCSDLAHDIRDVNIFGVLTKQPYVNQDPIMSKVKPFIITEAMRFPFSQILLLQNKRVKNKKTKVVDGIEVTAFAEKTRFCKPFQKCFVKIPYETGIDMYSGILEAAVGLEIVDKNGAWYTYKDNKFQESNADQYMEDIFNELVEMDEDGNVVLDYDDDEDEDNS